MRVLVTGARGKVGRATVAVLDAAGHDVTATDLGRPAWDAPAGGAAAVERVPYVQADLTDFGQASALVGGASSGEGPLAGPFDAVVHAAAIPAPGRHAPHVVFGTNLLSLFHVVESAVRWRVPRLVNVSSETVPGFLFAERPFPPAYLPVDEDHPVAPQDPYATAKHLGEQVCDAAVRRSDLGVVSVRPSWVQDDASWERNLGPLVADRTLPSANAWSYVDATDLAELLRLAAESDLPGHEVVYAAAPDTVGGRDLHAAWRAAYPGTPTELRPVPRPDASGIDSAKARRLLGWQARVSWRDRLDDHGRALGPEPAGGGARVG